MKIENCSLEFNILHVDDWGYFRGLIMIINDRKIATPTETRKILEKYNIRLNKRLGQHFLVDENILNKIVEVSHLDRNDFVLEIGAGIGTLTTKLARKARKVVAIEYDHRFIPVLKEILAPYKNVEIVNKDFFTIDPALIIPDDLLNYKLISNLAYNIVTAVISRVLEFYPKIKMMVIMTARDQAERMVAEPGGKNCGFFSIMVKYYAQSDIVARISRNVFLPRPNVDSAIVRIERLNKPLVKVKDETHFFNLIKAAFAQRRKSIRNALSDSIGLGYSRTIIENTLEKLNIPFNKRAEQLEIFDFAALSEELRKYI